MKNKEPIMIDQYHIDLASTEKLTTQQVAAISRAFEKTEWLKAAIRQRLPSQLQDKILISITR